MATKKKVKLKRKKKRWFDIHAPKVFNETFIGQTSGSDEQKVIGRTIIESVGKIYKTGSRQYEKVKLKIIKVTEEKADTQIQEYFLTNTYLSRITRKRMTKLHDVFSSQTKDGVKVRVTGNIFLPGKVDVEKRKEIRKIYREILSGELSKSTFDNFILSVIHKKIQKMVRNKAKKVNPVSNVEIIKIRRI